MRTISKQEGTILQHFNQKNQTCFTTTQVAEVYSSLSKINFHKILSHMTQKGLLMRIKEGLYCIIPYEQDPASFMPDWHLLVPYLVKDDNYYIGYFAALQVYQLNTQPSLKEQIVTNYQIQPTTINIKDIPFQFIYHNSKHFFGYKKTWVNSFQQVNCSDIEKTILDCLFRPKYSGGITEIAKAIYLAKEKIDMHKLFIYTQRFQSQAVIKRLGFILETLAIKDPILEKLRHIRSASIIPLEPAIPHTGKIVTRWSIQQNIDTFTLQSSIYT